MWNSAPKRVVDAATRFLNEVDPDTSWEWIAYGRIDGDQKVAADLVVSAFWLYSLEWGKGFDIRDWKWPIDQLKARDDSWSGNFAGNEPWTVLLRQAIGMLCL